MAEIIVKIPEKSNWARPNWQGGQGICKLGMARDFLIGRLDELLADQQRKNAQNLEEW
jgi:hypothetical protein